MADIERYDIAIIGAGPGGLSAGVYAARGGLSTVIFEKALIGGQITVTEEVENYPGIINSITGFEIAEQFKKHALKFGAEIVEEEVKAIGLEGLCKIIETDKRTYRTKAIVFATGAHPRKLAVPGEEKFTGRGVSYCATCDGAFYRDKVVAVIGGGDSAIEEAIFLTKFAKKVYIIHRRDELRAVKIVQERAYKNKKIEFIWDTVVQSVNGDNVVEKIFLYNRKKDKISELKVDGVFIYVGIIPNSGLIESRVKCDENGFIITDENMHTNVPGFYAAGDIVHKTLRQVVTAASDGAIAAFSAEKWIEENNQNFDNI
ncbi:MAG: thioredoxin reductase [Candidatus Cloacimonas sp. SDB]|nr:MAG: thioredoxin reductase [Candidatus Cloacimonas sp. SDB]